jgi:hypothetical protein
MLPVLGIYVNIIYFPFIEISINDNIYYISEMFWNI